MKYSRPLPPGVDPHMFLAAVILLALSLVAGWLLWYLVW